MQDFYEEIKNARKQSEIDEEGAIANVVSIRSAKELLSLPSDCNESNTMADSMLSLSLPNHSQRQNASILKNVCLIIFSFHNYTMRVSIY